MKTKRLHLSRETVRRLDRDELVRAVGGLAAKGSAACPTHITCGISCGTCDPPVTTAG